MKRAFRIKSLLIGLLILLLSALACTLTDDPATALPQPTAAPFEQTPTKTAPAVGPTYTTIPASCKVTADNLHLRGEPRETAPVLGYLSAGDQLTLTGAAPAGEWIQVISPAGLTGWVNSNFTTCKKGAIP